MTPKSLRQNSFISVPMSCAQHNPPMEKALFHRQIPAFGALGALPTCSGQWQNQSWNHFF